MTPIQLKNLKKLEQNVFKAGVDGGETISAAIEELHACERRLGVYNSTAKSGRWGTIHDVAIAKFIEFDDESVLPLLSILNAFFGDNFYGRSIWTHWSESASTYENDWNTSCDGTKYHTLCSVAIARPIGDSWQEKMNWWHGSGQSVINFHSEVQLRNKDSRIVGSSCSLKVSPYLIDSYAKSQQVRINYTTHGSKMDFHKNEFDMLRLCTLVKDNFDAKVMHDRLKAILDYKNG